VLCVTHLAQVAAQAHTQFRVVKQSDGQVTRTAVNTLTPSDRVDEIARMLGGIDITEQARAHAEEMLSLVTVGAAQAAAAKAAAPQGAAALGGVARPAAPQAAPVLGAAAARKKRSKSASRN
jgi:hypothetical protein